ncbi:hypothetical protein [Streptomyces sp. NBC_01716]|uniref:hypothetical protein n=1 Tax=Streptomyces sp. NBC_01716 TaxID=2975917 RepID=UPI002E34CA9B|nr:hypothetical protein [Streptomyces sp. NBC_01716]
MSDLVMMTLTFWHGSKVPGDTVEVRPEDVDSWKGYAVPADTTAPAAEKTAPKQAAAEPPKAPVK